MENNKGIDRVLMNRKDAYVYIFVMLLVLVAVFSYYVGYTNGKDAGRQDEQSRVESFLGE